MSPEVMTDASTRLLSEGVLGVAVFMLISALVYIYRQKSGEREAHKREIAAKDALITQLYEERIKETRMIAELVKSMESTLEAFLLTVRRSGQ